VQGLTVKRLAKESGPYDAAVAASADLDRFCSASDWVVPAALALKPGRAPFVRRGEHGYLALMIARGQGRVWLEPLEAMWGMGCPLVGADALAAARQAAAELEYGGAIGRLPVVASGFVPGSARLAAWERALARRYRVELAAPPTARMVASLEGGAEAYLARRSKNFRRALQRAERRAQQAGVVIEHVAPELAAPAAASAFARLAAVEARTWKNREGVGIGHSEMIHFYRAMVPRLAARGALRLAFARLASRDVAYILGGTFGDTYRGLQFGFEDGLEPLSLGNLCQWHEIRSLEVLGIRRYDLGAAYPYKRAWGEQLVETVTTIALPR